MKLKHADGSKYIAYSTFVVILLVVLQISDIKFSNMIPMIDRLMSSCLSPFRNITSQRVPGELLGETTHWLDHDAAVVAEDKGRLHVRLVN